MIVFRIRWLEKHFLIYISEQITYHKKPNVVMTQNTHVQETAPTTFLQPTNEPGIYL